MKERLLSADEVAELLSVPGRPAMTVLQTPVQGRSQAAPVLVFAATGSDRLAERVRRGLQTVTDLGEFTRCKVDAVLLYVRTRLLVDTCRENALQLVGHVLDDLGEIGKLTRDQRYVRVVRHPAFWRDSREPQLAGQGPGVLETFSPAPLELEQEHRTKFLETGGRVIEREQDRLPFVWLEGEYADVSGERAPEFRLEPSSIRWAILRTSRSGTLRPARYMLRAVGLFGVRV